MKRGRESIAGRRNSMCGAPGGREGRAVDHRAERSVQLRSRRKGPHGERGSWRHGQPTVQSLENSDVGEEDRHSARYSNKPFQSV